MKSLLITALVVGGLVLLLNNLFPEAMQNESNQMRLVYGLILLGFIGSAMLATFRQRWRESLRYALIWGLIALALVVGYAIRNDLYRIGQTTLAAILPGLAVGTAPGEATLFMGEDGHFHARIDIDGVTVSMLVDTGATRVALAAKDARRLGIDPGALDYSQPVSTANGRAWAAPIRLERMALGPIIIENVQASVMPEGALGQSLLGMSFLSRLRSHRFEGERMILTQ